MLTGTVGHYKYYKIEDMYNSAGCRLCRSRTNFANNIFPESPQDQHDKCIHCPIFYAVSLTKLYAKKLDEYDWRYEDDGK